MAPSTTIVLNDTLLASNETATVTITFTQYVGSFDPAALTASNGTLTDLKSADEGMTWTAVLTPKANTSAANNVITLNNSVTGGTGNTTSAAYTVDTVAPSAILSISDDTLARGETATITINFSEAVLGMDNSKFSLGEGTLSEFATTNEGLTWSALLTPAAESAHSQGFYGLNTQGITDIAGNALAVGATSGYYSFNAVKATIDISDTTLGINQTALVTIVFSERVDGFDLNDLTADSGTLSGLTTSDEGRTWTATLTPATGTQVAGNAITLNQAGVVSEGGVGGTGTVDSQPYTVDTVAPTLAVSMSDSALTIGETATVTLTFSEAVTGVGNGIVTAPSGTLSTFASSNGGVTWTSTFTPNAATNTTMNQLTLNSNGVTDIGGNTIAFSSNNTGYYSVDTVTPLAGPTATVSIDDTALNIGDDAIVTITFSELVIGFGLDDLEADSGTLSDLTSSDEGKTWTAKLTPGAGEESFGNKVVLDLTGVTGATSTQAGVGTTGSNAYRIDTKAPTATITLSDSALTVGETAQLTIVFSEYVQGLDAANLTVPNGTLGALTTSDEGVTWNATFTPDANVNDATNQVSLNLAGVKDLAGNAGVGSVETVNYTVNTAVTPPTGPTATVNIDDNLLNIGDDATVTITFSEVVIGFGLDDLDAGSGTLSDLTSSDEGMTWSAKLTPGVGQESFGNKVVLDLTGVIGASSTLVGTGTADSTAYRVDTKAPTATLTLSDSALTVGETAQLTIVFSEYVQGLDAANLTVPNGTLGALTTSDEGLTWNATFTPDANVNDATNKVSLNLAGVKDSAGNAGVGSVETVNYTVNTGAPVVVVPTPTPTPTPVLVDGVAVKKVMSTAPDGTRTQVVTIPTVTASRVDKDGTAALADIPLLTGRDGGVLLQVGLPVGFGVQASGASASRAADKTLADLLTAIGDHTQDGSAVQQSLLAGGSDFIASLDAATPLLVQTIVVSATTDASGTLVIRGAVAADGVAATALVIDGSALPDGTTIELQDVAFAVVTGNVRLVGGDGAQTIFGDGGSQNIVLGADDDVLHGGAGNDIVGSGAGNDRIYGDEGDDIVFGGAGDDFIDGGTGRDIVQMAGSSRDDYTLRVADGKLVMTHRDGGIDGTDTVANVEVLRFTGGAADVDVDFGTTDVASLVRLYETAFDRNPDEAGLNFWIARSEDGLSLQAIASAMLGSDEAQQQYQALGNEAFIVSLYNDALDRAGSAQEVKLWVDALNSGAIDRGTALLGFADSAEKIALVGVIDTSIETI